MKNFKRGNRLDEPAVDLSTMFTQVGDEMKIDHIRSAINVQRDVMLQIIEKKGVSTTFLALNAAKSVH